MRIAVDGIYGSVTARFIGAFQRSSELPETSTADAALVHGLVAMEG